MFRIVVKSNLTMGLAKQLMEQLEEVLCVLDDMKDGYESIHRSRAKAKKVNDIVRRAAKKWSEKASNSSSELEEINNVIVSSKGHLAC